MRVRMLMTIPGQDLFPGERLMRGTEQEVPDAVGRTWVGRMIAEPVVAGEVAVADNQAIATKRAPRRATTEE